jgi:pimeloyl-ACP methyl ester carboxylesterase
MVLVDSAHEGQISRLSPVEAKQLKVSLSVYKVLAFFARIGLIRLLARPALLSRFPSVRSPEDQGVFLTLISRPEYYNALCAESRALIQSGVHVPAPPTLGQIPLVVIQASGRPDTLPRDYSEERWQQNRKMFDDIQHELVGLSSNSQLIQADKSVHAVQLEQPEIVIAAIRQVAEAGQAIS